MTEAVFWESNPRKMKPYVKAYNDSKKDRMEEANCMNHIMGMYFAEALQATVCAMFSKKGDVHKYPEKPYELFVNEEEKIEKVDPEKEKEKAIAFLNRFAANAGKRVVTDI